mmetsp:Transcript_11825/g.25577  ORF Transcript_11825/g.25577 Transcript_11825/m.25577 type:complete len:443 (+) Transcript_11825:108-1436(+)
MASHLSDSNATGKASPSPFARSSRRTPSSLGINSPTSTGRAAPLQKAASGFDQSSRAPSSGLNNSSSSLTEESPPIRPTAYDPNGAIVTKGFRTDEEFWAMFRDVKTLGRGHFAKVKQIQHIETEETFAVKILDKTMADNGVEDMVREFKMLRTLQHPNIIKLYAAYETPRKLYLVTEIATGGELMKRLGETARVYSEATVLHYVRTMLDAIDYMHKKNCAHRDLKPENVLLSDMSEDATIKIVDLGLSRFFDERALMSTVCGTHKYLAPELVQTDRGVLKGYDKAIDMWGVGMLTFIMLFGFNPFARKNQQDTHNAIIRCEYTFPAGYTVSDKAKEFVLALLKQDPAERLTAEQALEHPWIVDELPVDAAPLLDNEKKPVKSILSEFNAQRMVANLVKGAHRRLSINSPSLSPGGRSPSGSRSPAGRSPPRTSSSMFFQRR